MKKLLIASLALAACCVGLASPSAANSEWRGSFFGNVLPGVGEPDGATRFVIHDGKVRGVYKITPMPFPTFPGSESVPPFTQPIIRLPWKGTAHTDTRGRFILKDGFTGRYIGDKRGGRINGKNWKNGVTIEADKTRSWKGGSSKGGGGKKH